MSWLLDTNVLSELTRPRPSERVLGWLERDLRQRFDSRILPVDDIVARAWGDLMGKARRAGRNLSTMDGFIAATALAHQLILRDTKDFEGLGIEMLDPRGT